MEFPGRGLKFYKIPGVEVVFCLEFPGRGVIFGKTPGVMTCLVEDVLNRVGADKKCNMPMKHELTRTSQTKVRVFR